MNALIVDDSENKRREISECISGGRRSVAIHEVRSAGAALREMAKTAFDLVVLDICLPERDGEPPSSIGYQNVLAEIGRGKRVRKPTSVIGLTEFSELVEPALPEFAEQGFMLLRYEVESNWKQIVSARVASLCDAGSLALNQPGGPRADVIVVTALSAPEYSSVLHIPWTWREIKMPNDFQTYHWADVRTSCGRKSVVAGCAQVMGLVNATSLAMKMCLQFRPRWAIMSGIAAGVSGKSQIGDLLCVREAWHYESGKVTPRKGLRRLFGGQKFLPDNRTVSVDSHVRDLLLKREMIKGNAVTRWQATRTHKPPTPPEVHVGPIACGSLVVADGEYVARLRTKNREMIGLEMESYGFLHGCSQSGDSPPSALCIKGVSDLADVDKGEEYRAFAAELSAGAAQYVVESILPA